MAKPSDEHSSEADETNLYITQLPEVFSEIQLRELFNRFGPIVTTRLITDQFGKSTCKGFVKFTERAHAEQAIKELNGSCLFNPTNPLQIKFAYKTASSNLLPTEDQGISNRLNSLGPIRNNRQHANNRFNPMGGPSNAGPLSGTDMMGGHHMGGTHPNMGGTHPNMGGTHPNMGGTHPNLGGTHPNMGPGVGQHTMFGQHTMGGGTTMQQPQHVEIPAPSEEMIGNCFHQKQGWSLYVSNLEEESDEVSIYKLFSPFGPISSINPMVDKTTGKCRGFGFVNMPNYDSAFEAVRLMHGVQVAPGKNLNVSFKTNKRTTQPPNYGGVP